ncbi:Hypothetical protein, putative [Bodo saltans]|uniref:Pseudouridylate synthase PUS7L N-terminal domain-containing protein n=1 Tax=Bodo saltans TaxID=75058 RepID=A0A0S4JDL8_BODSA|nr:Hypothetical protein, putative [Bodo saltans]|eukprot:CUG88252.1 Hypothetical protein, putative [Bodo saltans]
MNTTLLQVICCTIKHSAADFKVVEVDPSGLPVDALDYAQPATQPLLSSSEGMSVVDRAAAAPRWDVLRSNEPLERLLAEEVIDQLALLARSDEALPVVVGQVEDKQQRGALRCAIRWHYPNLVTTLDGSTLVASRDTDVFPALERCVGCRDANLILKASIVPDPQLHMHATFLDSATKDDRRAFHAAFQKACSGLFSVVRDGTISITSRRKSVAVKRSREEEGATRVFTHCVVHKRNVETQRMKELISSHCGVTDGNICVAGMKDRRADTWQRVSISGDVRSKLPSGLCIHDGEGSYIMVAPNSPVIITGAPLELGDLNGNKFFLVIRCTLNAPVDDHSADVLCGTLAEKLETFSTSGMLNYFGAQRFGRGGLPGIKILQGDWCGAVAMILNSAPEVAREALYATGDFGAFRKAVNPRTHRDAHLLGECLLEVGRRHSDAALSVKLADILAQSPAWAAACRAAILKMPFYLRQLWLHAAQSHIFNKSLELCADNVSMGLLVAMPPKLPLVGSLDVVDPTTLLVLTSLSIDVSCFATGTVAGVPLRGSMRETVVTPTCCNLRKVTGRQADSPADVWVECSFTLPSSSYATVLLHQLCGLEPTDAPM